MHAATLHTMRAVHRQAIEIMQAVQPVLSTGFNHRKASAWRGPVKPHSIV
jgi:hypothetical protein